MRIFRSLTPLNKPSAVALGYFDGVHRGHREVILQAVRCKEQGLVPAVFTFSSTPKPGDGGMQLSRYDEKLKKLETLGVEALYVIDFNLVKNKTPHQFVREVIKDVFNAKEVFCGFNYRFGKDGLGATEDLARLCLPLNIKVGVTPPVIIDGEVVSSSKIRALLRQGDIKTANRFLGYAFGITGIVEKGNHIGSQMETPTVNQRPDKSVVLPRFGVYASLVTLDGVQRPGVTNIGVKPTVSRKNIPLWETWMPRYKGGNLYGKTIDVRIMEFIRPEQKFPDLEKLRQAVRQDGKTALKLLEKHEVK